MIINWKINHHLKKQSLLERREEVVKALLISRGLITKKDKEDFLNPLKPEKIKASQTGINATELKKAVKKIKESIAKKELIYIFGDFDTDGVSATTVLWEVLNKMGAKVMPYIPSREDEVRGLSIKGIDQIIEKAKEVPKLIITVDNGITAFAACQYAAKKGIKIIITDHHQPKKIKGKIAYPKVIAVVATKNLAGAGVAWYLAKELSYDLALDTLGVASLGTIADMVSLLGTNRSLAKFGLESLRKSHRPGIKALAALANLDLKNLEAYQVGYSLSPRINAMARLGHALDSVRLLCFRDNSQAKKLALSLDETNLKRQELTTQMFSSAVAKVDLSKKLIFITGEDYHEGIVGLVAGQLAEKYNRPAIVVALNQAHAKASARAPEGFNLIAAIRSLEKLLINHGGHERAAGFTAKVDNLDKIKKELEKLAESGLEGKDLSRSLNIDCQIEFSDINWGLYDKLAKFRPFGMDNPEPVFVTRKVMVDDKRAVGQDQKHLKLRLKQGQKVFEAIAFNKGHLASNLKRNQLIDAVYTVNLNHFNGRKSLQLKVEDIQAS